MIYYPTQVERKVVLSIHGDPSRRFDHHSHRLPSLGLDDSKIPIRTTSMDPACLDIFHNTLDRHSIDLCDADSNCSQVL